MRVLCRLLSAAFIVGLAGCAATPPPVAVAPPQAPAPVIPLDRKAGWILRLEQSRILQDATLGADLAVLARDHKPHVRRRAVLAIGRVGMAEGIPLALTALGDPDESVRATAAFALGLLGDATTSTNLEAALKDTSPLVRARAAGALGLIGATGSAAAIAEAASGCATLLGPIAPDDEDPKGPAEDACRESIVALVRLRQFDALARIVLDANGAPVSKWWPVAFGLQRSTDARAANALATLAAGDGVYTRAFALRGLAGLKDARAIPIATAIAPKADVDVRLRAEAIRALGRLQARSAVPALLGVLAERTTPDVIVLETVTALGAIADPRAFDAMLDLFTAPAPSVRAAAMSAAAAMDRDGFLLALSGMERDRDWSVRANLAAVLAKMPADTVRGAVEDLAADSDVRVQGPALRALAQIGGADVDQRILRALEAPDFVVRATAASLVRPADSPGGAAALAAAYTRGESDANHAARVAALDASLKFPLAEARPTLMKALEDREWAVRLAAARFLKQAGVADAAPARPAPVRQDAGFFESERLLHPAYTPHVYIQTRAGRIHLELNMIDAPFTSLAFVELARSGFFNGLKVHRLIPNFVIQAGDPRGDGEGGPGYAIRDELSPLPFVRGSLGMALDGRDTGGSQFFITLSPQPHLDGQYTVFGRVIDGWDVLDRVAAGDVIESVIVRDGT